MTNNDYYIHGIDIQEGDVLLGRIKYNESKDGYTPFADRRIVISAAHDNEPGWVDVTFEGMSEPVRFWHDDRLLASKAAEPEKSCKPAPMTVNSFGTFVQGLGMIEVRYSIDVATQFIHRLQYFDFEDDKDLTEKVPWSEKVEHRAEILDKECAGWRSEKLS